MEDYTVKEIWREILDKGEKSSPRGKEVINLPYFTGIIRNPFSTYMSRKYPVDYLKKEFTWFLGANPYDVRICKHAKTWNKLVQDDGRILSNYGWYWFGKRRPDGTSSFHYVVSTLFQDPYSRQAVIPMLEVSHQFKGNIDVVCTKDIQFSIIDKKLWMKVSMRSSDAVFGAGTDLPCFHFLHQMVACALSLEMGEFIFSTDSIHIYEKHYSMVNHIVDMDEAVQYMKYPKIDNVNDLINNIFKSNFGKWLTSVEL